MEDKISDEEFFNPFRCDMWSVGVCLEIMCKFKKRSGGKINNPLFNEIVTGLKRENWRARYDAKNFCNALDNLKKREDVADIEKKYLEILKIKNFEKNKKMTELYSEASMPKERLEFLEFLMNDFLKENKEEISKENWKVFDELLWKLGKNDKFFIDLIINYKKRTG